MANTPCRHAKCDFDSEDISYSESLSSEREPETEEEIENKRASDRALIDDLIKQECDSDKIIIESEYESAEDEVSRIIEIEEQLNGVNNTNSLSDIEGRTDIVDTALLGVTLSDENESINEDRQQGDGEECAISKPLQEKVLDYDEDRRNPQYIPKNGTFYEHDDRINDLVEEKDRDKKKKKKQLWQDSEKWGHDRYHEEEQIPKSRDEIISVYGYDIRNEDIPPRARRPRRYGHGPTKYSRSWEDENAYSKNKFMCKESSGRGKNHSGRGRGYNIRNRRALLTKEDTCTIKTIPDKEPAGITDKNQIIADDSAFPALPNKDEKTAFKLYKETRSKGRICANIANINAYNRENSSSNVVKTQTFENSVLSHAKLNNIEENINKNFVSHITQMNENKFGHDRSRHINRGYKSRDTISVNPSSISSLETEMENLSLNHNIEKKNKYDCKEERWNKISEGKKQSEDLEQNMTSSRGLDAANSRTKRYSSLRQRSLPESPSFHGTQISSPPHSYDAGSDIGDISKDDNQLL